MADSLPTGSAPATCRDCEWFLNGYGAGGCEIYDGHALEAGVCESFRPKLPDIDDDLSAVVS